MAWVWTWLGGFGAGVGLLIVALSIFIYVKTPARWQKRFLSLLLAIEGLVTMTAVGLMYLTDQPDEAYGWQMAGGAFMTMQPVAYLLFLGTIASPLAKPFRVPWMRTALLILLLVAPLPLLLKSEFFIRGVVPGTVSPWDADSGPGIYLVIVPVILASLFGLAVALHAWRRAPPGTALRKKNAAYALAFGYRDAILVVGFTAGALWAVSFNTITGIILFSVVPTIALLGFAILLSYGMLKSHLFDADLKIKIAIRRTTVVAAFGIVFFVVEQIVQNLASAQFGIVAGAIAAGILLFAIAPLSRIGRALGDLAMPHVHDSPEYATVRKLDVYRAAVESALEDGVITDRERAMLATLQDELGITARQALDVERASVRPATSARAAPA